MSSNDRPISPHLQIYRPQLTSVMSISHRVTGVLLSVGLIVLAYWVIAAATGPDAYATAQALLGSWLGQVLLFFWSFALYYHLCNGIRHLVWDTGNALELEAVYSSGYIALAAAVVLTLVTWIVVAV